jgi:hypothetical protein
MHLASHLGVDGPSSTSTAIHKYNKCVEGKAIKTVKQRFSKAMDMCLNWIFNLTNQLHFIVHEKHVATNQADYFSKNHPPAQYQALPNTYLQGN